MDELPTLAPTLIHLCEAMERLHAQLAEQQLLLERIDREQREIIARQRVLTLALRLDVAAVERAMGQVAA